MKRNRLIMTHKNIAQIKKHWLNKYVFFLSCHSVACGCWLVYVRSHACVPVHWACVPAFDFSLFVFEFHIGQTAKCSVPSRTFVWVNCCLSNVGKMPVLWLCIFNLILCRCCYFFFFSSAFICCNQIWSRANSLRISLSNRLRTMRNAHIVWLYCVRNFVKLNRFQLCLWLLGTTKYSL